VTDSYYYNDSTDYVFILILDGFCPKEFYRSWLKSWAFGNPHQLLVARSCQKPKQTGPLSILALEEHGIASFDAHRRSIAKPDHVGDVHQPVSKSEKAL
jgi:hypothetical protein